MLEIEPFGDAHLEEAANMVSVRIASLRRGIPAIPPVYAEATSILPLLQEVIEKGDAGAAAIRDGQLVGFLMAWQVPSVHGVRSAYTPEWAHAAVDKQPTVVYQALYRHLSHRWVEGGYGMHYISLLPNDRQALRTWSWLGFGMFEVDAIRSLELIPNPETEIYIREAEQGDLEDTLALERGLCEHVRGAPVFLPIEVKEPEYLQKWIDDPQMHILLAILDGDPVGYMCVGPANPDVCTLIFDERTASVYRAFTKVGARSRGYATALLNRALAISGESGYQRMAVDYEAANPEANQFWPRYFVPVCYSLQRAIDPRFVSD